MPRWPGRDGFAAPRVFNTALGNVSNQTSADVPGRSNLEFGIGTWTDGALAASGVACAVAVPIDPGTTVTTVTLWVGATAASTPTHSWAALYSGIATPAQIGTQSTDGATAAIGASAIWQPTITPYQVKAADCPNGYIYVAICVTGTAAPTAWGLATPIAVNYQGLTASTTPAAVQPMYAATSGSALGATAPNSLTLASKAVAPVVLLT